MRPSHPFSSAMALVLAACVESEHDPASLNLATDGQAQKDGGSSLAFPDAERSSAADADDSADASVDDAAKFGSDSQAPLDSGVGTPDSGSFGNTDSGTPPPATVYSKLPLTMSFQSWATYYPMARNQGRGNRWSNPWVQGAETQTLLGQYTWQYPAANDGTGTNRPNGSLPSTFALPGFYSAHAVEYFLNINCSTAGACNKPNTYQEIISESGGSTFLELWGAGNSNDFIAYLDDQALPGGCTLANAQTMMASISAGMGANYREPLAFPLPASPGFAGIGNLACEVLLGNFSTVKRARLALVVTENRKEANDASLDPNGVPWKLLYARNIYFLEKDGSGGCAGTGGDTTIRVPVNGSGFRDAPFCIQNYEVYAMRSIPSNHRGQNGFGSWNNSGDPLCTTVDDCAAHGGNSVSYNRHWVNQQLAPAFYEACSLGAAGLTCTGIAAPPGT